MNLAPSLLIRFNPFVQSISQTWRDVALLVLSHSFNIALQPGVNSKSQEIRFSHNRNTTAVSSARSVEHHGTAIFG